MKFNDSVTYLLKDYNHIVKQLESCSTADTQKFNACLLLNNLQMNRLIESDDISEYEKEQLREKLYLHKKPRIMP